MQVSEFVAACLKDLSANSEDEAVLVWCDRIKVHEKREDIAAHFLVIVLELAKAGLQAEVRRVGALIYAAFEGAAAVERALNRSEIGRRAKEVLAAVGTNPTAISTTVKKPAPMGVGIRAKKPTK